MFFISALVAETSGKEFASEILFWDKHPNKMVPNQIYDKCYQG